MPTNITMTRAGGAGAAPDTELVAAMRAASAGELAVCPLPVLLVGRDGIVCASPAASAFLGADGAIGSRLSKGLPELGTVTVQLPGGAGGADERLVDLTVLPFGRPDLRLVLIADMTLERNLRRALSESRQRYKDLVEASSDFAWETDAEGNFALVSSRGALGYEAEDLVGRPAAGFVIDPPADGPLLPFMARRPVQRCELWFRDVDGRSACLVASGVPLFDAQGVWRGARGVCRDVTATRARDAELAAARHRERLMAYVLATIGDIVNPAAALGAVAGAVIRALTASGCAVYQMEGQLDLAAQAGVLPDADCPIDALDREGKPVETPGPNGRWLAVATRVAGRINGAVCLWRAHEGAPWDENDRRFLADIAGHIAVVIEQAAQHRELERLSNTDSLTGLENRRAFFAAMERRIANGRTEARRSDAAPAALVYVDLDNFKQVNDARGHQQGDEALAAVAAILRRNSRAGDRVARLGGDEFALWLEGTDMAGANAKAHALLASASELARFSPPDAPPLGFSIGVAVYDPRVPERLAELVARADGAMYAVKRSGKGGLQIAEISCRDRETD